MEIPQHFTELLEREFNGRLRIRWSNFSKRYRIEQRVARAQMWPDKPLIEDDDEATMIRDGYFFVMAITPGDKIKCNSCGSWLDVPHRQVRIFDCGVCKMMGRTYRFNAGFFPLNDDLITYLKSIDPERDMGYEQLKRLKANNERLAQSLQRQVSNNAEAYGKDNFNQLVGIPQFGRTGKEKAWLDAPEKEISNERQKQGIAYPAREEDQNGTTAEQVQGPTIVVAQNNAKPRGTIEINW